MTNNGDFEPDVCIVTPVFNGSDYIDETIASVIMQAGDFYLRYHIQDGGSTDDTLAIVERWHNLVTTGALPMTCKGLEFTYSSERDAGMYDAINRGFQKILPSVGNPMMGWINADDRIAQGGLATGLSICRAMPEVRLFGGRVALINQHGYNLGINLPISYSRPCMAAGLYDGRSLPFVMQEGTFWRADLWHQCGGLDDRLKLAGDWDLWRRFAEYTEYFSADTVLGFHRRRPGQLSGQMDKYYAEVDMVLSEIHQIEFQELSNKEKVFSSVAPKIVAIRQRYEELLFNRHEMERSEYASTVLRFNLADGAWGRMRGYGLPSGPAEVSGSYGTALSIKGQFVSGFSAPEGPHPEFSIPFGMRWLTGEQGLLTAEIEESGRYDIVFRFRAWGNGRTVAISVNGRLGFSGLIRPYEHDRETEVRISSFLPVGLCAIELKVEAEEGAVNLMVMDMRIDPILERGTGKVVPVSSLPSPVATVGGRAPLGGEWPRISVIVPTRNQAHFIGDTMRSLVRQGYPNLEIIVCDGASTDETTQVLREFERHITYYISEPDEGQSHAINKGMAAASGDILTWLNSDDLLASGALHAVAFAFLTEGVDMVSGVCDVFGDDGAVMHRHLPCLQSGPLPLNDLLDLENCWLRGQFFHQPEVFFSRAIWEKAGGLVRENLYYSMDYDLWVRMAQAGARIQLIGRTVAYYRMHADQKTSTVEAYRPELTSHASMLRAEAGMSSMPARREDLASHLKILMLNDYGFNYGAGIAHRRLAQALQLAGQDVVAVGYAEFDRARPDGFDPELIRSAIDEHQPDLIVAGNLHSIRSGPEPLEVLLSLGVPVVFFAHDQWIVTGRCAYTGGCPKFLSGCDEACPTAAEYPSLPPREIAPSFRAKRALIEKASQDGRLMIVTNSRYMERFIKEAAGEPLASHVRTVALGVDTRLFTHGRRREARQILGLPQDRFIILTAASNIDDERKGLPLLIEALKGRTDLHDVVLVIIGWGKSIPETPCEVRFTGYAQDERLVALYFQAADIFVGPSKEEALGQTFIEAGACGTPSVTFNLGGIPDAVVDGVTGLLVEQRSAEPLGEAIADIKRDAAMRRSMGANAVLHVRNRFSLERAAADFLSMLVTCKFGKPLAPSVNLRADGVRPVRFHYLAEKASEVLLPETPSWFPVAAIESRFLEGDGSLLEHAFVAVAPRGVLAAEAVRDASYKMRLGYRMVTERQRLTIVVNDTRGLQYELKYAAGGDQEIDLPLRLRKGYNRIIIEFSEMSDNDIALIISSLEFKNDGDGFENNIDGLVSYGHNFGEVEGPYPEFQIDSKFRWALGDESALQIFSACEGERELRFGIRNFYSDQVLGIDIDGEQKVSVEIGSANASDVQYIVVRHFFHEGFADITFRPSVSRLERENGRSLSFALSSVEFGDRLGDRLSPVLKSAVQGSLPAHLPNTQLIGDLEEGSGFGPLRGPFPELGIMEPVRWITSASAVLTVNATGVSEAVLTMRYRMVAKRAIASLDVNGEVHDLVLTSPGALSGAAEVKVDIRLIDGPNILTFAFSGLDFESVDGHPRVLLLESLTIVDMASGVAMSDATSSEAVSSYARVRMGSGIADAEAAYPPLGLEAPFYWVCDTKARLKVEGNGCNSRVRIAMRNQERGQRISVVQDGELLVQSDVLPDTLDVSSEIQCDLYLAPGWNTLDLIASSVSPPSGQETRSLSFLIESIEVTDLEFA
ncbi:glycosyltransferase [Sphingobium sp. SYK-6]|uniref:glycosyltransferase n=1 Tax=Sphingobium sp. (strain NBRC 103272 / SYK-6) TaxID=627192 RepID=UPI000308F87F|nr:glycosyltransferase [Sphingobium sp. SYK-6]